MAFFLVCILSPPLLVQRCNGTAAGLGHLEAGWMHNSSSGSEPVTTLYHAVDMDRLNDNSG
jgi:hypothetical protein